LITDCSRARISTASSARSRRLLRRNLERRPRAGGRTLVRHPSGRTHHDDFANVTALAATLAMRSRSSRLTPVLLGEIRVETISGEAPARVVVSPVRGAF